MKLIKHFKKPAKASIWYLGTSLVCKGIGIIATPFFTRLQSAEDYGTFSLYISVLGVMSVIVSALTTGSSVYRGLYVYRDEKYSLIKSILIISLGFSVVICTLLFTFSGLLGLNKHLVVLIFLQLVCDVIIAVRLSTARFFYEYKEVAIISIFESLISPAIAIMILSTKGGGYDVRIYSLLFVSMITAVQALTWILRGVGRVKKEMLKHSFKSSIPLLPHSIGNALSGQADKLIFTTLLGTAALAKYSVVHSIAIGLSFAIGALGSALGPWIIRRLNAGESARIGEVCELIFKALAAATVFLIALAPEAMMILAPPEYSEAITAVLPISLSVLPSLLISITTVILIHADRGRYTSYASIVTVASGIILNFFLIPRFYYFGAGIALLLSQLIGAWISLKFMKKTDVCVLPIRKFISLFALTALLGAIMLLLYDYPAIRVLLLSLPAVWMMNLFFLAERLVKE